jgi:hypothetical protein
MLRASALQCPPESSRTTSPTKARASPKSMSVLSR